MEPLQPRDTMLRIHISHSKPIDLIEFSETIKSFGNLYSSYVSRKADCDIMTQSKLYVEKVEEGSILFYLCETVATNLIPFVENANTILGFAEYFKNVTEYLSEGKGKDPELTLQNCNDFHNAYNLVAGDVNGTMEVSAVNKNDVAVQFNNCTFNYNISNASQNSLRKKMVEIKAQPVDPHVRCNVVLQLYQIRNSEKDTGNRAIIEEISEKDYPLTFANQELADKILRSVDNPLNKGYLVDVEIKPYKGGIVYLVMALHDVIYN